MKMEVKDEKGMHQLSVERVAGDKLKRSGGISEADLTNRRTPSAWRNRMSSLESRQAGGLIHAHDGG